LASSVAAADLGPLVSALVIRRNRRIKSGLIPDAVVERVMTIGSRGGRTATPIDLAGEPVDQPTARCRTRS
jgi:hypothetical protein